MKPSRTRCVAAGLAAVTAMAMTTGPAVAAEDEGPYVFDSAGTGQALSVVVGLPQALADGLAPVIQQVPGVELIGNELQINLSNVLAELELPLAGDVPGEVTALADANSVTGSLSGLVDQLLGGTGQCLDSPVDITVPPGAETPLVSLKLLEAECTESPDGRVAIASSRIADLEINLAGALAILPPEVAAPVTETVDTVTETVEESVLGPIVDQVLTPVQDALNENLGLGIDLTEAVRVPELIDLPLVSIDLIESVTQTITDGDRIESISTATLAGVSLLGTVCIPDTTYRTVAFATGQPGENGYESSIPPIDLAICDTDTLSPILRLLDVDGVVGDVLVNLGDGQLKPLGELLGGIGLPTQEILDSLDQVLATLGVSTVVQGRQANASASDDGRQASVAVNPFRITVAPLAAYAAGTPLEGLKVELRGLTVASEVAAVPAPPDKDTTITSVAPPPQDDQAPVSLPRTGGGAVAMLLGVVGLAGAFALRRRT